MSEWSDKKLRFERGVDEIEIARLIEQINKDHQKLWSMAMKAFKINSKTYRKICLSGKHIQEAHHYIWNELSNAKGCKFADQLMESHSTGCCYN